MRSPGLPKNLEDSIKSFADSLSDANNPFDMAQLILSTLALKTDWDNRNKQKANPTHFEANTPDATLKTLEFRNRILENVDRLINAAHPTPVDTKSAINTRLLNIFNKENMREIQRKFADYINNGGNASDLARNMQQMIVDTIYIDQKQNWDKLWEELKKQNITVNESDKNKYINDFLTGFCIKIAPLMIREAVGGQEKIDALLKNKNEQYSRYSALSAAAKNSKELSVLLEPILPTPTSQSSTAVLFEKDPELRPASKIFSKNVQNVIDALDPILNPNATELKAQAAKQLQTENFDFILAYKELINMMTSNAKPETITAKWNEIYNKFLGTKSNSDINISGDLRKSIEKFTPEKNWKFPDEQEKFEKAITDIANNIASTLVLGQCLQLQKPSQPASTHQAAPSPDIIDELKKCFVTEKDGSKDNKWLNVLNSTLTDATSTKSTTSSEKSTLRKSIRNIVKSVQGLDDQVKEDRVKELGTAINIYPTHKDVNLLITPILDVIAASISSKSMGSKLAENLRTFLATHIDQFTDLKDRLEKRKNDSDPKVREKTSELIEYLRIDTNIKSKIDSTLQAKL